MPNTIPPTSHKRNKVAKRVYCMKRAGSHGSMVDENPFFQALLLARAIDQIKGQSEERRALLDVLAVSSQGLMGTKEIIKNKIGRERGMRSLQPEDSGDLVSILDKYFNIVEARMNSVEELITFLNRLNCSASAPEDSGDLVSILDKYFNIVEARMNSVEELITFLNRLNCSASDIQISKQNTIIS